MGHSSTMAERMLETMNRARATLHGLTGIFRLLARDHAESAALLRRVRNSDDPALRSRLFPIIRRELLAHEQAEVAILFPVLSEIPALQLMASKHDLEATELAQLIEQIAALDVENPIWVPAFDALVITVSQHVREEERLIFPRAQRELGRSGSHALKSDYQSARLSQLRQVS